MEHGYLSEPGAETGRQQDPNWQGAMKQDPQLPGDYDGSAGGEEPEQGQKNVLKSDDVRSAPPGYVKNPGAGETGQAVAWKLRILALNGS
jgi:hypothetical protein